MVLLRSPSRLSGRDAFLVLIGAFSMHMWSFVTTPFSDGSKTDIVVNTHFNSTWQVSGGAAAAKDVDRKVPSHYDQEPIQEAAPFDILTAAKLPSTTIAHHAPGWTFFHNIYMSNGTLFVVSDAPREEFPEAVYMTSTGLEAKNEPDNIRMRLPTKYDLDILRVDDAMERWGKREGEESNRVWTVEGSTMLFNDPPQFLNHYYHFAAELLFGAWAFWSGAHSSVTPSHRAHLSYPQHQPIPAPDRAIFSHSTAAQWRDNPGFNAYFLRAAFPSLALEMQEDWQDRSKHTQPIPASAIKDEHAGEGQMDLGRAYHFPTLLLADRSAAFKGAICGMTNQRTAAEAYHYMREKGILRLNGNEYDFGVNSEFELEKPKGDGEGWWNDVRKRVVKFAGVEQPAHKELLSSEKGDVVITYISRQGVRRRVPEGDHEVLVSELEELVRRKNAEGRRRWEVNVVRAERLSKDEQVRLASRTTIMLGVHGNGLSHLILMPPSPLSTVIEIFYPQGFAHDYEWTSRSLGIRHFAIWNDTHHTYPNTPQVSYPEGFQGTDIPVYGPYVAKLIEDRVEGRVP